MAENHFLEDGRLVYAKGSIISGRSGAMAGIAGGSHIFSLRVPLLNAAAGNQPNEPLIVSSVRVRVWTETAFTAAQGVAMSLYKVSGFTVLQGGGTAITSFRNRTSEHAVLTSGEFEARISGAAALNGGTPNGRPAQDEPIDTLVADPAPVGAAGFPYGSMIWQPFNRIPITLEGNEGLMIINDQTLGAGGALRMTVSVGVHKA